MNTINDNKVIKDISTLTNIPTYIIYNIFDIIEKEIQRELYESIILYKKDKVDIDLGIGNLLVNVDINNGTLTYDFIPSKSLEKGIIKTLRNKENPMIESIERNLKNKVLSIYKELI